MYRIFHVHVQFHSGILITLNYIDLVSIWFSSRSEKTCPSADLSITNPTCNDPGSKSSRRVGKPATNRLSYGTIELETDCFPFVILSFDVSISRKFYKGIARTESFF
jgi:hypothetical protein